tara:strand:+ start:864 stop:1598 length:735 start_codon:yes stop_codon:yes gene_type:complete
MKKVLIIGANSDMGKSFARDCAQKGSDLILTGRDQARLEQLADDLKIRNNIGIETILFDITKRDQIISFYENLPSKPDVVACFIGFLAESDECANNFEITENIININFTNIILILDQIANAFENFNNGTIIAVSSTAGDRGRASRYHYGSAKSGLNTYLSGLRQRLYKSNVRVINIKPGFCGTKMIKGINTPEFLTSNPEDVSKAILRAIKYNLDTVYVYWFWKWIMLIIKLIPEFIFKRLNIK